ncbi:hypothetical protein TrVE_jg4163 [Triparma verrucosa]|uniref:PDZ domain-containing protein n=1 Tax=Triparma verrucosa TaxID=1606542 RepID=A0A9W7ESX5_9STRA|nr:hypothetical protein TrVE_jg4163 [Triparma verrucosa]
MSQHTDADSAVHVRDARQLNGDSTPLRNTSQPTSTQSATPSNSSTSPNGDVTTSTIRGATPGAQVRERNSELEALAKLAPVQKKRDSFVELEEEQRRRRSDVSMTSQSSSRRGSRQVTIEESPLPSKSQPGAGARAGASVAYLEDGLVAGSSPVSDPLLQLPNTYKIVLERDAPPLDSEFEDEEDEYDPSLGVHFYIPPPTSAFDDQSTNDFLSQLTGGGSLLREASTGSNGESAVSANSSMLIIRSISPLSSGKSSPAQRCGMLNKGDVVLRINEETVWGRGVMELGEIISRQMGWKEGGDNSDRMKIELLCVIGEGAEIIKGLEERERRLKNRGGKGRGGGEVDSLLSFLGGADNMLGGSSGFEANRSDYYSSDDEDEEAGNLNLSSQWEEGASDLSTEEVPLTHFVPLESNVIKVKNPFVSTLTPLRSSAGEDELVRRILGKITTALSVDEEDEGDILLGERVVDEEEYKDKVREGEGDGVKGEGQEKEEGKEEKAEECSVRVDLWNKIVEEAGGNLGVEVLKHIDRLSEDEWTELLLRAVQASLDSTTREKGKGKGKGNKGGAGDNNPPQSEGNSNALSPPEVTSFGEDDTPADKSTNKSVDEMFSEGFGDIFGVPTTPSKGFLEVVNPRAVPPEYAPPYHLTEAIFSCGGGRRGEILREWTKFLGNREVEKVQMEGEDFPHLSQMCCELLRNCVVERVAEAVAEDGSVEWGELASFVETNVYYLAFVEDTCTEFCTRLLTACVNEPGSDPVVNCVLSKLVLMDGKHQKQIQEDSLDTIIADKDLVEKVLVNAFPLIRGAFVKRLLADTGGRVVFFEYCAMVLKGASGEEGARDRGLVEGVCTINDDGGGGRGGGGDFEDVDEGLREEVVRAVGGFSGHVMHRWWREAVLRALVSMKAWDVVEVLMRGLAVEGGLEEEEVVVVGAMRGLCDHKLDSEDWGGLEAAMRLMYDLAKKDGDGDKPADVIIDYLAHRVGKRTTTEDVSVFEKIVALTATRVLKPNCGLELLRLYTLSGSGVRNTMIILLFKAAEDGELRDELSVAWDRLQRMREGRQALFDEGDGGGGVGGGVVGEEEEVEVEGIDDLWDRVKSGKYYDDSTG